MNNLKYYDQSLAYNFEMFQEKPKADVIPMPRKNNKRNTKNRRKKALATYRTAIIFTVVILGLLVGNLLLRSEITKAKSQIDSLGKEISEMESEETRLNVAMEKKLSYKNLEEEAYILGMRKMDKNQVVYIKANENDKAVTKNGEQFAENNK